MSQAQPSAGWPFALVSYGSDHHFDHHLGLSTEIRLSAESVFLRETGRLRTSLDTLPMSGVNSHEFFVLPTATAMILPSLMILCLPMKA